MEEYRRFLSDKLLSDEEPITYRILSRALDIHVNTAKEMLYDFHQYQNNIKPKSVYATYLLFGRKRSDNAGKDGDVEMSSSPPGDHVPSDDVVTDTLTLVGEDALEKTLSEYEDVGSIHVHTLSPQPKLDYAQLVNLCDAIPRDREADPMEQAQKYGFISNSNVRRRDRRFGYGAKSQASIKVEKSTPSVAAKPVKSEPAAPARPGVAAKDKETETKVVITKETKNAEAPAKAAWAASKKNTPAPSLKRGGSSGIMGAFANAATKPAKPAAVKKQEEDAMALSDDGEADEEELGKAKSKPTTEETLSVREKKAAREAELRRMMEEEDGDDEAKDDEEEKEDEDEKMRDASEEPEAESGPVEEKKDEGPSEVVASSGDGRKRGKRRVMKKKRVLDDDGYMVTIQEAGWESFSEEDVPPPAKKQAVNPPAAAKGPKKPAAKGQGSIMSFFGKK